MFSARILFLSVITVFCGAAVSAQVIDFEDLTLPDNESAWSGEYPVDGVGGTGVTTRFSSGPAAFLNFSDGDWGFWEGFAYSNMSDTTNGGYQNQFSAYPGSGIDTGDDIYAVGYMLLSSPQVEFEQPTRVCGAYFANTTYTALSMVNGAQPAKKFGGPTGDDPDWLCLTVTGLDETGSAGGSVHVLLADYRPAENSFDYVLDGWQFVDLSPLGEITRLEFSLSSSDSGPYGMNTPAYFAMDGLVIVPEPAGLMLLAAGGLLLRVRRRGFAERTDVK